MRDEFATGVASLRCAALLLLALSIGVGAQPTTLARPIIVVDGVVAQRSVGQWLARMHEASHGRAYVGTFVVAAAGSLSSARIWHVCDGQQQVERVESLTGAPRSTFRRNDQVFTFLSERRVVVAERRESLGPLSGFNLSNEAEIAERYGVKVAGHGRVAGFDADVLELQPRDDWRFGYRVWSEARTGLVVKLQTLDGSGKVLEQAAFSELQLDAPVSMDQLTAMMKNTHGYKIEKPVALETTASAEGWAVRNPVPGFKPGSCFRRVAGSTAEAGTRNTMQCVFSDGLASVSLFVETLDPLHHQRAGLFAMGATHTLAKRMGDWWVTVVGEVPVRTLIAFAQGLERSR